MRRLTTTGGPTLIAFLCGAVGMVAGAILGWALLRNQLGPEGGRVMGALCASYVGGSINFCAVSSVRALCGDGLRRDDDDHHLDDDDIATLSYVGGSITSVQCPR